MASESRNIAYQRRVARNTLAMSLPEALMKGGMSHETAYHIIYKCDLRERLLELIREYGVDIASKRYEDGGICWELETYGWTPAGMHKELFRETLQ